MMPFANESKLSNNTESCLDMCSVELRQEHSGDLNHQSRNSD